MSGRAHESKSLGMKRQKTFTRLDFCVFFAFLRSASLSLCLSLPLCLSASLPVWGAPWFSVERNSQYREIARKAKIALENRQWNDALTVLEKGRRRFSKNVKIRLALAYLYRQIGLFRHAKEQAHQAAKRARGKEKNLAWRELALANFKLMLYEDAQKALEHLQEWADFDWALQGRIHAARGQWVAAAKAFEHIQNKSPRVFFWQGWCLWRMGKRASAQELFKKAGPIPGAGVFPADFSQSGQDPWLILARGAAQRLSGEPVMIFRRPKTPLKDDESDGEARQLLEKLSR
ncbi:MAG: hypothetical protein HY747_10095 [Elusimicrobia bacterium]|nr:hypothetical protein [Elusimicrobiota bacterium]